MYRNNDQHPVRNLGYSQRKPFSSLGQKNQNIAQRKQPSSSVRQFLEVPLLKETLHHTRNVSEYQNINGYKNLTPLVKPDPIYTDMKQNSQYFTGNNQIISPYNIYSPAARSTYYQYHSQIRNIQQLNPLTLETLDEKIMNLSTRVLKSEQSLKMIITMPTMPTMPQKREKQRSQQQKNIIKQVMKQQQLFFQNIEAKLNVQADSLAKVTQQIKSYKSILLDQKTLQKIKSIQQELRSLKSQQNSKFDFSVIKHQIKSDFQTTIAQLGKRIQQLENKKSITQYKFSTLKCLNSVTKFKYSESIEILPQKQAKLKKQKQKEYISPEIQTIINVYYIDCDGYLLDDNQHYILNSFNKKIMIGHQQLQILRKLQSKIMEDNSVQSKSNL